MSDAAPFRERLNTWVQTIGILTAGAWGIYAFVYKEIRAPQTAPVNVSVDLKLETTSSHKLTADSAPITAVTLNIAARNPSSRTIDLLPSAFVVYGFRYSQENDQFESVMKKTPVEAGTGRFEQRHTRLEEMTAIAIGNAVGNDVLRPNESLSRNLILYVPSGSYDVIEAVVGFPSVRAQSHVDAEWRYDSRNQELIPTFYRVDRQARRREVPPDSDGRIPLDDVELQIAWTRSQVALGPASAEKPTRTDQ